MAGFKEVFGFEPAGVKHGEVKVAEQVVVNVVAQRLVQVVEACVREKSELIRLMKVGNYTSPVALMFFASPLALVEEIINNAEANFNEAVKLAREAGFAVMGTVVDTEVERVFHLKEFHKPLTGPEAKRVRDVLEALAGDLDLACDEETDASNTRDINRHTKAMEELSVKKTRFWDAHALAKNLGLQVSSYYRWHCPWSDTCWDKCRKENFVAHAKRIDLI